MSKTLPFNLHTHTSRCGHAVGEDEEYVIEALHAGISILGFSDHVFLPGLSQPGIRGDHCLLEGYLSSISALKHKYAGKCQILTGFEAEWYGSRFEPYYRSLLKRDDFDYFILGQHCFIEGERFHWYASLPRDEATIRYKEDLIEGMASGIFTYVAHPDIYISWRGAFDSLAQKAAEEICEASIRYDVPLEINFGKLRTLIEEKRLDAFAYPCRDFWQIASEHGVKAVIGVDAHNPKDFSKTDLEHVASNIHLVGIKTIQNIKELRLGLALDADKVL